MSGNPEPMQPVVNPLPPVVVALALAIFAVESLLSAGARGIVGGPDAVGWRLQAIEDFGFFSQLLAFLSVRGDWTSPEMVRFVSYPFVHYGFTHAIFVIVFLLALGKLVGEVFGSVAVIVTFFLSAIFGALIYAGLTTDPRPLTGGFPAVYGLIGTYTFILWTHLGDRNESQWRAFTLIGFLMLIQLVFGLLFGSGNEWVAEIAGFLFGFTVAPLLARGGFQRLIDRLRQR